MKIAPRAEITEEFKTALREIYTERLVLYKKQMNDKSYSNNYRKNFFNQNKMKITKLINLLSDQKTFDFELTRMRALPYSKYEIRKNSDDVKYLCALSFPIEIRLKKSGHYGNSMANYNMGSYWVCTKLDFLKGIDGSRGSAFHFYPEAKPLAEYRTPHHYGSQNSASTISNNPLDMTSNACLGGFNAIIYSAIGCGDVTEYLRSVSIYLTRHNPNDTLTSSHAHYFAWAVPA